MPEAGLPVSRVVEAVAKKLESDKLVAPPAWSGVVKTGAHAERVPQEKEFWYKRCASLLVTVSRRTVGVQRLRNKYGGKTSNRVSRSHHKKAGGKSVRLPLQQLEKAGFLKKGKKGRTITPAGIAFISKASKA